MRRVVGFVVFASSALACGLGLEGTLADSNVSDAGEAPEASLPPAPAPPPAPEDDAGADAGDASDAAVDAQDASAITFVQQVTTPYVSATTITASLNVTAGNALVVAAYWSSTQPVTVTDTLGNTFVPITASGRTSCNLAANTQLWYALAAKGGADTVTLTAPSSSGPGLAVLEYAGVAATGALDVESHQATSSTSSTTTVPNLTTTGARDVIIALFADCNGSGTMSPGMGFTARSRDTTFFAIVEDNLPGVGPGTYPVTATLPVGKNDNCWAGTAIALRAQ